MDKQLEPKDEVHLVVAIGASAGGLEAIKDFFEAAPADTGLAFVVIQHLDPTHESRMVDLISNYNSMQVRSAEDGLRLEPNRIYVIPPNSYLSMQGMALRLTEPIKRRGQRMPIDYFFQSMARELGPRGVAIILSGTGSDGTLGMKEVKNASGITMVQDPESAQYDGMPRSALATGLVDVVLPPEQLPERLVRYAQHPFAHNPLDTQSEDLITETISLLFARAHFDFRPYKRGTLTRRIQRRMGLRQVDSLRTYVDSLRDDEDEMRQLTKDLLIGVTSFFRDPEAWQVLETEVLPDMLRNRAPDEAFRVWVAGCNTGEEAYSIAILLTEQAEQLGVNVNAQIFATDVDPDALEVARAGRYPKSIASELSGARLSHYFIENDDYYEVKKRIRESVVFAEQNLISDPPFSKLDLILCRNVLIYLEPGVQSRILSLLHFGLMPNGVLFMGNSETVGRYQRLFNTVSKTARVYRKVRDATHPADIKSMAFRRRERAQPDDPRTLGRDPAAEITRRALLETFTPAAVLIDRHAEVLYFHGPTNQFLQLAPGEPTGNLMALAREGLKNKIRVALRQAIEANNIVKADARRVRSESGKLIHVTVTVTPLARLSSRYSQNYLVSFSLVENQLENEPQDVDTASGDEEMLQHLEYELQATREDLQSTIEELETSNEELKASNEEVMSMNEELQSSNEELETSREELQSMNEELITVNAQLEEKLRELEGSNNDLYNLLSSTDVATLFLDTEMKIRRFTPAAAELFHLIEADLGRPMADVAVHVDDPALLPDCKQVLRDLVTLEATVQHDRQWFVRRTLPYRTEANSIEGVVVIHSDVTKLQTVSERLQQRERQLVSVSALGALALQEHDFDVVSKAVVRDLTRVLGVEYAKILHIVPDSNRLVLKQGFGWQDGLQGEATVPDDRSSQAGFTLAQGGPVVVQDLQTETRFSGPDLLLDHGVRSGMSVPIRYVDGQAWGVLGVHSTKERRFNDDDINYLESVAQLLGLARHRSDSLHAIEAEEQRARDARISLQHITDNLPVMIAVLDKKRNLEFANPALARFFDLAQSEIIGQAFSSVLPDSVAQLLEPGLANADGSQHQEITLPVIRSDGIQHTLHFEFLAKLGAKNQFKGTFIWITDITDQRRARAERALLQAAEREREHIGAELHDSAGQTLSGLNMLGNSLLSSLPKDHDNYAFVDRLVQGIREAMDDVRSVTRGLLSEPRDGEELLAYLGDLTRRSGELSAINCHLRADPIGDLDPESANHLFRIAQEAVSNALRHSNGTQIIVQVVDNRELLELSVLDDGDGYHPGEESEGFGIELMQHRADVIGASLTVGASELGGCSVTCRYVRNLPTQNQKKTAT